MSRVESYNDGSVAHGMAVIGRMRKDTSRFGESMGTRMARKVFSLQKDLQDEAKSFPTAVLDNDTLPGRVSLVTHLAEFCNQDKNWTPLLGKVKWLGSHRIPHPDLLKNVMEITIGIDNQERINKAITWVEYNLKRDLINGCSSTVAADTESLNIAEPQLRDIPGVKPWDRLMGYLERPSPDPLHLAASREKGVPMPVRIMFGGLDWMLTIRLPVEYSSDRKKVNFKKSDYQPSLNALLDTMPYLIGSGIKADIAEITSLVHTLWPKSDFCNHIGRPVEIQWLLRFAGIATSHSGVHHVLWWALHFFAPKSHFVSTGDGMWGLPFCQLPEPLQLYCLTDTIMVARATNVIAMLWMANKLPDLAHIYQVTGLRHRAIMTWFLRDVVIKGIEHCTACDFTRRTSMLAENRPVRSISDVLNQLQIPSTIPAYQFYTETAEWPSVTAGGARFLHSVRAQQTTYFQILFRAFPNVWPLPNPSRVELHHFFRPAQSVMPHPSDPVQSPALQANPGLQVLRAQGRDDLTVEKVNEIVAATGLPRRAVILEAFCLDPEVGAQWLSKMDRNRTYVKLLLGKHVASASGLILELRDLADFLNVYIIPMEGLDPYKIEEELQARSCLLYTSDAADE